MTAHARLSPSAAIRWINCPGSIRLSESLPAVERDTSNRFSREGTLAHEAAEIMASVRVGLSDNDIGAEMLDDWARRAKDFDVDEMRMHAQGWAALIGDLHDQGYEILLEQRVATGVQHSWGTADAVAYKDDFVIVLDYKYGKGVEVEAQGNPQLMLYGLGVLESYAPAAVAVQMIIHQPRRDHHSVGKMTAAQLRRWRDQVAAPAARLALSMDAPFAPSEDACRFCPAAGVCLPRSNYMLVQEFGDPECMTAAELADVFTRLGDIESWISAVREASLLQIKREEGLPGYKLVRKTGRRKISDPTAVAEILGEDAMRTSLRPLGELEKLAGGKGKLTEKLGDLIQVSSGSEVIVPEDDPRPASHPGDDFDTYQGEK